VWVYTYTCIYIYICVYIYGGGYMCGCPIMNALFLVGDGVSHSEPKGALRQPKGQKDDPGHTRRGGPHLKIRRHVHHGRGKERRRHRRRCAREFIITPPVFYLTPPCIIISRPCFIGVGLTSKYDCMFITAEGKNVVVIGGGALKNLL